MMKPPSPSPHRKTARDIQIGDEFTVNIARRRNQWSQPTLVRATNNATPSDIFKGNVRIEVIVPGSNRKTTVILPASKQV